MLPQTRVITKQQSLKLASVELVVVDGPDRDKKLTVAQAKAIVGTAPSAQLRLTDEAVSRLHCEVPHGPGNSCPESPPCPME